MFLVCMSREDLHLFNGPININAVKSLKSAPTTFLFVESDITRAVIVCRAAHCIILGRDVLELLRDDPV